MRYNRGVRCRGSSDSNRTPIVPKPESTLITTGSVEFSTQASNNGIVSTYERIASTHRPLLVLPWDLHVKIQLPNSIRLAHITKFHTSANRCVDFYASSFGV